VIAAVLVMLPYHATRLPDDAVLPYGWQIVGKPSLLWREILSFFVVSLPYHTLRHA